MSCKEYEYYLTRGMASVSGAELSFRGDINLYLSWADTWPIESIGNVCDVFRMCPIRILTEHRLS
jgi:hypothetical protein